MNKAEILKYWEPDNFYYNLKTYSKQELILVLLLLKEQKISLEGEE
tara:strand:- start:478 stop:615 length:138 start_codon:yes stop_codon:yes gene_type:complete